MENSAIPPEIKQYADFANSAYKDTTIERRNAILLHKGWEYIKDLSDKYTAIWMKGNTIIMANRGTVVTDPVDLIADASIVGGSSKSFIETGRYQRAKKVFLILKEKYPSANIILTGHSLGGSVDNSLYRMYENSIQKFYNYNPGSGINAGLENIWNNIIKKKHYKAYNNYIKGDPISALSINTNEPNTKIFKNRDGKFAHSLANFIN